MLVYQNIAHGCHQDAAIEGEIEGEIEGDIDGEIEGEIEGEIVGSKEEVKCLRCDEETWTGNEASRGLDARARRPYATRLAAALG